tara:strand:+ start:196 stop:468 length:273 start_codon:yes stop_codon:yes gene_type:complete
MVELYKPFNNKLTPSNKKYSVYVKANNNKGYKIIHFGSSAYGDFASGTATASQRSAYLKRARGIKDGEGRLTYKNKNSANYWSIKYLWNG